MAIRVRKAWIEQVGLAPDSSICFSCGRAFNDKEDIVYWAGVRKENAAEDESYIDLHVDCAVHLGVNMIGDAAVSRRRTFERTKMPGVMESAEGRVA